MADNKKTNPGKGMAIAAMVCGIVSICGFWIPFVSIPCGIVALVLGIIALVKKKDGKGMAIAGVATGSVGFLGTVLYILLALSAVNFVFNFAGNAVNDIVENANENVFSELEDATDKINACLEEKGVSGEENSEELTPEQQAAYIECL